jgi:hypothetical protein
VSAAPPDLAARLAELEARMARMDKPPDLQSRPALRADELAAALGTSKSWVEHCREIPRLRRGGIALYPLEAVRVWLREQTDTAADCDAVVDEMLEGVGIPRSRSHRRT